jgi:hypothetical protein
MGQWVLINANWYKPLIAPKMVLKPFAGFKIADRLALALDVAALSSGPIENVIG